MLLFLVRSVAPDRAGQFHHRRGARLGDSFLRRQIRVIDRGSLHGGVDLLLQRGVNLPAALVQEDGQAGSPLLGCPGHSLKAVLFHED
jgi:hypothetical protein